MAEKQQKKSRPSTRSRSNRVPLQVDPVPIEPDEILVDDDGDEGSSSLPTTIFGAANAAANSGIGKLLLSRSVKALGEYWGEVTEEKVRKWRDKRAANANDHIEAVARIEGPPRAAASEGRARLQYEWAEAASQVDASEQPELAAAWRAALARIMKGDPIASRMLRLLKTLEPDDLHFFLTRDHFGNSVATKPITERLESAQLIARGSIVDDRTVFILALGVVLVTGILFSLPGRSELVSYLTSDLRPKLLVAGIMGLIATSLTWFWTVRRYRLTMLGVALKESAEPYLREVKSHRKSTRVR